MQTQAFPQNQKDHKDKCFEVFRTLKQCYSQTQDPHERGLLRLLQNVTRSEGEDFKGDE